MRTITIKELLAIIARLELAHGGYTVIAFANDLRRAIEAKWKC